MRYVIIGVGVAGISAAEAIRSVEKEDEIIMISNDPGGYYSRPGLAYYLSGEINEKGLFPGYQRDWIEKNVHLISGKVIAINPNRDHLVLQDGRNIPYDRLLLATGSYAKPLEIPGSDLLSVIKLDDYEDSKRIIKLSKRTRVAVVIGGGITALELVEGLMARNVKIHFLIRGERYWNHVLDEAESRLIEKRLEPALDRQPGDTLDLQIAQPPARHFPQLLPGPLQPVPGGDCKGAKPGHAGKVGRTT